MTLVSCLLMTKLSHWIVAAWTYSGSGEADDDWHPKGAQFNPWSSRYPSSSSIPTSALPTSNVHPRHRTRSNRAPSSARNAMAFLILVIGDLHIPDRALDIPAKVHPAPPPRRHSRPRARLALKLGPKH